MSILDRLTQPRHLDDREMAAIWSNAATTDSASATVTHGHLAECAACRTRYAAFAGWLGSMRHDAVAEADEVFPAERLTAQQAQILRRLEALEHPARVIAFPRFARHVTNVRSGPQRWVAAAAAASFIVGLAAGQFLDLRGALRPDSTFSSARLGQSRSSSRPSYQTTGAAPTDEAFLYDAALVSPPIPELQALDAITPHVRDMDQSR